MGGAPTIAMLIIQAQTTDLNIINNAFRSECNGCMCAGSCYFDPKCIFIYQKKRPIVRDKNYSIEKHIFDA